ncbi:hypothetical protein [Lewinella sp. IMCC34191]|uniref:hypothetical protein n=1 Tax=Lewinella sp. IMCC34191 TaxID=2259172 RepID=UPI000E269368|nr:hypothetical protein [Lewinella sp. IMCC34191]
MKDFSIDLQQENFYFNKTSKYFEEVASSYHNENYRGTLVLLYSVVICDVLFKLTELKEVYSDSTAQSILDEIEQIRSKNPKSSDWEKGLIEMVSERTDLFDIGTHENIIFLEKHRHLCAHPVLTNEFELYQPNRETARAHIRNMAEGLFLRSPILSRKVFLNLIQDLVVKKSVFVTQIDLNRYLESKYFKKLSQRALEAVFKDLWKFVFVLDNAEATEHRLINYQALKSIIQYKSESILNYYIEHIMYFSDTVGINNVDRLIDFYSRHEAFYTPLEQSAKLQIENRADKSRRSFVKGWFLANSFVSHFEKVKQFVSQYVDLEFIVEDEPMIELLEIAFEKGYANEALSFCIHHYTTSNTYDSANKRFRLYIIPFIEQFTEGHLVKLFEGIDQNSQTYDRRRGHEDHRQLIKLAIEKFPQIQLAQFSNLQL